MTKDNTEGLMSCKELLKEIQKDKNGGLGCHLLLGNGFNSSLGINTRYKNIFEQMQEIEPLYNENIAEKIEEDCNYDIEKFIKNLKGLVNKIDDGKKDFKKFLETSIEKKVKLDFIKACSNIIDKKANKIYRDENIKSFFNNFSNYFTLNFDPFLYLLLMKKKEEKDEEGMEKTHPEVCENILNFYQTAEIKITWQNKNIAEKEMDDVLKKNFELEANEYCKIKFPATPKAEIKKVVDFVWTSSTKIDDLKIKVNDGFYETKYIKSEEQNLFFLHGAFHIYEKKFQENMFGENGEIYKITQTGQKSFLDNLQKKIDMEDAKIIFILKSDSVDKKNEIEKNHYLMKGLEKLSNLSGSIVILGSCLDDNDKHIF